MRAMVMDCRHSEKRQTRFMRAERSRGGGIEEIWSMVRVTGSGLGRGDFWVRMRGDVCEEEVVD